MANPVWRALWEDNKIYDESGIAKIGLIKAKVCPIKSGADFPMKELAGATPVYIFGMCTLRAVIKMAKIPGDEDEPMLLGDFRG